MALKRSSRPVRFGNVSRNRNEDAASSSSESESESANKVRKRFSTKRLMKDSECYEVGYDHIYSAVSSCESNKKRKTRESSREIDDKPMKSKCFSKNAIMARLNRERKKMYVSTLENENESLREQNSEMSKKMETQTRTIDSMKREIVYLKGLLANSNELGQILKGLQNSTNLPITSSLLSKNESCFEESKQIVKPNSLAKFPMIYEDINLGSTANKSLNENADFENCLTKDEYDSFLRDEDLEFNENFALEDSFRFKDGSFYSDPCSGEFGICLHVNQKSISIEVCSICNGKANSCLSQPNSIPLDT